VNSVVDHFDDELSLTYMQNEELVIIRASTFALIIHNKVVT